MKRIRWASVLFIFAAMPAFAMATIEFLKLDASGRRQTLEPIIYGYLASGYKRIPEWVDLQAEIRKLALEKGYSYQNIEEVAKEAATRLGMTR